MSAFHEFECPRDLYEKLTRDNERLEEELNGDNIFTFASTVVHLQPWIKNSPLEASETVKRMMRKVSHHPYVKICDNITSAKNHFKLEICDEGPALLHVDDEKIEIDSFRHDLMDLFDNFFKHK
ncbi:MAG: hypothetical protein KKF62_12000 [Bacteroidetes bacterium]|nr:hypothetical protein [Bacteroidota bacterium]MBU1113560.1 hypothetical protein [Bacteroidota bacterium]MBU1800278.1 hypothetical protein [Bacteroidota bacterium]